MKTRFKFIFTLLALFNGCTKEEVTPRVYPRVDTNEAFDITSEGATFKGEITFSNVEIKDHGFVWSHGTSLQVEYANKISLGTKVGTGFFESRCERSLEPGRKYYVRAFAISEDFTVYGKTVEFTSLGSKAPVVKDFFPVTGTWGDTITVVGENFSDDNSINKVKFGEASGRVVRSGKDTLTVEVPNNLTTESSNLSVTIFGNVANFSSKAFTLKAPVIESISPMEGAPGNTVTLTGKFFNGSFTKVYFNGIEGIFPTGNQNQITVGLPSSLSPGPVEVKVVTGTGSMFDLTSFTIKPPHLAQLSPASAGEGDEIKLIGNFFSAQESDNVVTFGGVAAVVTSATPTELTVIVPQHVGTISADVKLKIGSSESDPVVFSFLAPVVESFTPTSGYGSVVTITGKNFRFGGYNSVYIGDLKLENVYAHSSTKIEAYTYAIPKAHSGKVKVVFESQEGVSTQDFKMPWIQLADYPAQYSPSRAFINNNNAYIGFSSDVFNKLWRFNSITKAWTQMADFPGQFRNEFAFFTAGSKGYIGGGYVNSTFNDWWEYNFSNNTWSQKSNLPIPGLLRASFAYNGNGYVLAFDPESSTTTSSLWKYNHTNDTWSVVSTAPFSLPNGARTFIANNMAYIFADSQLWRYDFVSAQWTLADPQHNGTPSAFMTINGTGYGYGYSQGFQKFDPALNTWTYENSPLDYNPNTSLLFGVNGHGYAIVGNMVLEYEP